MIPIMLDTNAYSEFKRGNKNVREIIKHSPTIAFSPVVLGELLGGFARGNYNAKNKQELQLFLSSSRVRLFQVTSDTAKYYAQVYERLYKKGKPIPTNDMWIAAQALEHGCMLCTFDKHFQEVGGLLTVEKLVDALV